MNQNNHPEPAGISIATRMENRAADTFADEERRGLMLATKVRTLALLVILGWLFIDDPDTGAAFYYSAMEIASFALLGGLQYLSAKYRFGKRVLNFAFVLTDCLLLTLVLCVPNPFSNDVVPAAVAMDSSQAGYFYIFLMQSAFSLRSRLVLWCGLCIIAARSGMLAWYLSQPGVFTNLSLTERSLEALLSARTNPDFIFLGFWVTEIIVILIMTVGLSVVVDRSRRTTEKQALTERTRASLARYFSPNMVDHVSSTHHLLDTVRKQKVAVLFVDIMGFTKLCESVSPERVVSLLRDYHSRLGQAVFDNQGTLDKYIGDGLMATFGTPEVGTRDAENALQCALDMLTALDAWNNEREAQGDFPVRVGIGLHYGVVIAGDIGNDRRLEYSVIGDTVNIASRLEQLTRTMHTPLVVSDDLIQAIKSNVNEDRHRLLADLSIAGVQELRGRKSGIVVWTR